MGKVSSHSKEKIWENINILNLWVSLIFHMKQKSIYFQKHWKSGFPMFDNVQIPQNTKWKYSAESHIIPKLWVFEEIRSYNKTQIIHREWVM